MNQFIFRKKYIYGVLTHVLMLGFIGIAQHCPAQEDPNSVYFRVSRETYLAKRKELLNSDFFYYRKYKDGARTDKQLICLALIHGDMQTQLVSSGTYPFSSYRSENTPTFIGWYQFIFEDSTLFRESVWGKAVYIDMRASKGSKLQIGFDQAWEADGTGEYLYNLPYYSSVTKRYKPLIKITYVHNLGFVSEERSYKDSTVQWKLEAINGIPLDTFMKKNSSYRYFRPFMKGIMDKRKD